MRVLSVTHGPTVPGGLFDEAVEAAGHMLERWLVPDGGSPDRASSYDAVMVFGGSQHPDQDDRFGWLGREEEFLRDVLADEVPVFGVCLGAQMLARAAGASVGPASAPEIGWLDVSLTDDGAADPVLGVLPARATVFQWHHYTFTSPAERCGPRRQRGLPAGVPPRRAAGLGDPVPRRGHGSDGLGLDGGGSRGPADARRRAPRRDGDADSAVRQSRDERSPTPSSARRRARRYAGTARDHSCHEPT